jgi:betaine lipid synthase
MDQRVFDLGDTDHVITIASAGCNVLDYIIEGAMVTAVDFNLCQIALTELKKVAILNCEHDVFFEIFSKSNMAILKEIYPKTAPSLERPFCRILGRWCQHHQVFHVLRDLRQHVIHPFPCVVPHLRAKLH